MDTLVVSVGCQVGFDRLGKVAEEVVPQDV